MGLLIRSKVQELRYQKSARELRPIPLRTLAKETGLSLTTVQRLVKGDTARVYMSTLDTLCRYFGVSSVADIIEYVPDNQEGQQVSA